MPIELTADVEPLAGEAALRDGWRGLLDFGEVWTAKDADLLPEVSGVVPEGQPLTYGCELRGAPTDRPRATLVLWFGNERRDVMKSGATFTLNDGATPRASGRII